MTHVSDSPGHRELPEVRAPADRFCDLVMKGGVTSGIVYPPLIASLARFYRFKNIGGTSAGAIAATATAAAEYARRRTGTDAGFHRLADLPAELAQSTDGRTHLLRLFQPDSPCERLFAILSSGLNRGRARVAVWYVLGAVVAAYAWSVAVAAGAAALILVAFGTATPSWIAAVLVAFVTLIAVLVACIYFDITHGLVHNRYGLCSGLTRARSPDLALTPWLHNLIQVLAGRRIEDAPLTFRELWTAPGAPAGMECLPERARRSIDLRLFTTNLTQGRPYFLPHDGSVERLFVHKSDLSRVLPPELVDWMAGAYVEPPVTPLSAATEEAALQSELMRLDLFELTPDNFPIVLAARLSLSFPVLLSAVQLWVINRDEKPNEVHVSPCLFSDGGLCSNFPIHLFDSVLPAWPTFGIQLEPRATNALRVALPQTYDEGYTELWNEFDRDPDPPARLFGFFGALLDAMQSWNDNSLARLPGVRDRVVRVRLERGEGGLNLNMDPKLIRKVSALGVAAADALEESFVDGVGWDAQRNVRLSVLAKTLEDRLRDLQRVVGDGPHVVGYDTLLERATHTVPPGFKLPLAPEQLAAIRAILAELETLANVLTQQGAVYGFEAVPETVLRIRPTI
jgi:predicted acylesterase/phospholipase RssA